MSLHISCVNATLTLTRCTKGNEYATYTYPDGRERHTVNGREQITPQQHVKPQRIQAAPQRPPPIQTSVASPPPPYSTRSRTRDSPTSTSSRKHESPNREHHSRKRDSPNREHHSPIEIQSSSHAGTPISHHYRSPSTGKYLVCFNRHGSY